LHVTNIFTTVCDLSLLDSADQEQAVFAEVDEVDERGDDAILAEEEAEADREYEEEQQQKQRKQHKSKNKNKKKKRGRPSASARGESFIANATDRSSKAEWLLGESDNGDDDGDDDDDDDVAYVSGRQSDNEGVEEQEDREEHDDEEEEEGERDVDVKHHESASNAGATNAAGDVETDEPAGVLLSLFDASVASGLASSTPGDSTAQQDGLAGAVVANGARRMTGPKASKGSTSESTSVTQQPVTGAAAETVTTTAQPATNTAQSATTTSGLPTVAAEPVNTTAEPDDQVAVPSGQALSQLPADSARSGSPTEVTPGGNEDEPQPDLRQLEQHRASGPTLMQSLT
jgi:hypothetical protein